MTVHSFNTLQALKVQNVILKIKYLLIYLKLVSFSLHWFLMCHQGAIIRFINLIFYHQNLPEYCIY